MSFVPYPVIFMNTPNDLSLRTQRSGVWQSRRRRLSDGDCRLAIAPRSDRTVWGFHSLWCQLAWHVYLCGSPRIAQLLITAYQIKYKKWVKKSEYTNLLYALHIATLNELDSLSDAKYHSE